MHSVFVNVQMKWLKVISCAAKFKGVKATTATLDITSTKQTDEYSNFS